MFWDLDVQDSRRIESRWAFSDGWTSQNGMRGDCRGSCQLLHAWKGIFEDLDNKT